MNVHISALFEKALKVKTPEIKHCYFLHSLHKYTYTLNNGRFCYGFHVWKDFP